AVRTREFDDRAGAAHALELNNVGELKIAQRTLKFFGSGIARPQQTFDKIDKVPLHERFFQKMDRSEAADLFALLGQMDAGQHDRARIGMTRPEIVKEVLSKLVRRVHVENEQLR